MISDVGVILGIFIGVSCISFAEILYFILEVFMILIGKKIDNDDESNTSSSVKVTADKVTADNDGRTALEIEDVEMFSMEFE